MKRAPHRSGRCLASRAFVAQTFLSAMSPTFLSADFDQYQFRRGESACWKALRYGRHSCLMPLGFDPVHPGGMDENSQAFQRWERGFVVSSPEGTAEWVRYRPSLRDLSPRASTPSVETLGYSRRSLQGAHGDPSENLVALDRTVCATLNTSPPQKRSGEASGLASCHCPGARDVPARSSQAGCFFHGCGPVERAAGRDVPRSAAQSRPSLGSCSNAPNCWECCQTSLQECTRI